MPKKKPPIGPGYRANLDTIIRAARNGDLALVDCQDKATGKQVVALCAIGQGAGKTDDWNEIVPLAKLFDGNPYNELNPPAPEGGYR